MPNARNRNQVAMAGPGKEDASCGIDLDTRKTKIERLIRPRSVVANIRPITERDSRKQFAARALVELVPDHLAVRECLGMIRADNTDPAREGRSVRREKDSQQNRDSHPTNAGRDEDSPVNDPRYARRMDCKLVSHNTT